VKKHTDYGFISLAKDEKVIMKSLNEFLDSYNRVFAKTKSKGLLEARLPFVYKHFYFNLNKEMGVYMEVYPNQDIEGRYKYSDYKNVGWILTVRILDDFSGYQKEKTEGYIKNILDAVGLDFITLNATDIDDDVIEDEL
jgi:hypothetical protein